MGLVASTLAATVAGLIGILVGAIVSGRSQRLQWSRDTQLIACSELLRSYSSVYAGLSHACRHNGQPNIDWTEWNQCLAALSLVSIPTVMDAALAVDDVVWLIDEHIVTGRFGMEKWLVYRRQLETARLGFVNAARSALAIEKTPLTRVVGTTRRRQAQSGSP
jgi:hypothetical protein